MGMAVNLRRPMPPAECELGVMPTGPTQWDAQGPTRVKEVMTWNVSVVSPMTTLQEGLHLFRKLGIEALVVYDGRTYQGVVTHSSLDLTGGCWPGSRIEGHTVSEVIDKSIEPLSPNELLADAWQHMREAGHICRPVLNTEGKLIGLLTTTMIEARFSSSDVDLRLTER